MVCDGHRIHIKFSHPVKQRIESNCTIQETVLGVDMKVYEVGNGFFSAHRIRIL